MNFTVTFKCKHCGRLVAASSDRTGKYFNVKCGDCGECAKIRVEIQADDFLTNHEENETRREYNESNSGR